MDFIALPQSQYKIARMNADIAEKLLVRALHDMQNNDHLSSIKLLSNAIKCSKSVIDYCLNKMNSAKLNELHRNAVNIYVAGRLNRGKLLAKINLHDLALKDFHAVISGSNEHILTEEAYRAKGLMVEEIRGRYDNSEDGDMEEERIKLLAYVESELL